MEYNGMSQDNDGDPLLGRVSAVGTSSLSDAMDSLAICGVTTGIYRRSGRGCAVGYAETITSETGELGAFDEGDFSVFSIFNDMPRNGMLVIALAGAEISSFGGLAGLILRERGAAGAIIDGACRDIDEIIETGITVASRHVTPRGGRGRVRVIRCGDPVVCGGVTICSGDVIIVDETGVIAIPRDRVEEVMEIAESIEKKDAAIAKRFREQITAE